MNFEYNVELYDQSIHGSLEELCTQTRQPDVQMLPITPEDIQRHTNNFVGIFGDKIVAYCGQTATYEGNIAEVGSLIVHQDYRKLGLSVPVAEAVVASIIEKHLVPIAFCNSISAHVFQKKLGFALMKICEIPDQSLILCNSCPKQPKMGGCCDRVYVHGDYK